MSDTQNKILKFTQNHLSKNIPFEIYVDTECLLVKISSSDNSPTKSFKKTNKQTNRKTSYGYSLFILCLINGKKSFYREQYIAFLVPLKKENENYKTITYKIVLTDIFRVYDGRQRHQDKWKNCNPAFMYVRTTENTLTFKLVDCHINYERVYQRSS